MDKIYIVTVGSYSDYRIEAVFSTREDADIYCDFFDKSSGYTDSMVEEYDVDKAVDKIKKGYLYYFVKMHNDGAVDSIETCVPKDYNKDFYDYGDRIGVHVWAKDKEHAIKICNEKRTIHLAKTY